MERLAALIIRDIQVAQRQNAGVLGLQLELILPECDPAIRLDVTPRQVRLDDAPCANRLTEALETKG